MTRFRPSSRSLAGRAPRLLVWFSVLVLLVAACGGDDDQDERSTGPTTTRRPGGGSSTTTGQNGKTPTTTDHNGGDNGSGLSSGTTDTTTSGGNGSPGTTSRPGGGTTVAPPTTRARSTQTTVAQRPDPHGPTGSFATALLGAKTGGRLVVELLTAIDGEPRQSTVDHVVATLRAVSGKDVVVGGPHAAPAGDGTWTDDEIRAAADAANHTSQGGGQVVIRLLLLRGRYARSESVLGVAVRGDVAAVFPEQVAAAATVVTGPTVIERAVTTHEVGHLLGLVDLAMDTGRDDPKHPGHSTNQRSVMYWVIDSLQVTQVLEGGPPDDFDAADQADLAELRRRGS